MTLSLHALVPPAEGASLRRDSGIAPRPRVRHATLADAVVTLLEDLDVRQAFGVVGGAVAPFCEALTRSSVAYLHFRHESGAAFAATEASLASGRPTLVFATTGPGVTNALTGLAAARVEGASVVLVSAATSPAQRGRHAAQETSNVAGPLAGLLAAGPLFHYAASLEHPSELDELAARLARGVRRPGGFVAHVSLPLAVQTAEVAEPPRAGLATSHPPACDVATAEHYAALLSGSRFALWVGHGARGASAAVRALAERSGAPVLCTPRGKGIFPERHPQFLGVTGVGGSAGIEARVAAEALDFVVVLGTRLGEGSSSWSPEFVPPGGFVHVDVDPDAFGAAYPTARTCAVQAEVNGFVRAMLAAWPSGVPQVSAAPVVAPADVTNTYATSSPAPSPRGLVRPRVLMAAIQRVVVDGSDALVMAECGNAFAWATHLLRFDAPARYRVSPSFGAMGHMAAGVVGAALARGGKAVALVGDGAMLMLNEVSSAVQHGADAVWVVLNDGGYGMCRHGMEAAGWEPFGTTIPRVDFAALARALGATGERVGLETDLTAALERALAARGPVVLDVAVDPADVAPLGRRNENLFALGGTPPELP